MAKQDCAALWSKNVRLGAELTTQFDLVEVDQVLNARFLDGIQLCRWITSLFEPSFSACIFYQKNRAVW
ncbi:hypothetical protein Nepgr_031218 [Nepenthes gracilis]|uniref:Uncharacterized protein n=1 Tax=Nepenthes gracilis TaxID=150966 RepID=A0AAD3TGA3_NEPGR|nr:hypothetical protein Nepgr_031218 [Nepenthes gracilis]